MEEEVSVCFAKRGNELGTTQSFGDAKVVSKKLKRIFCSIFFNRTTDTFLSTAFFIPYVMALFLIGIPTLILEISLGQVYQTGCVGAFGALNQRVRGIGVASAVCAFFLVSK